MTRRVKVLLGVLAVGVIAGVVTSAACAAGTDEAAPTSAQMTGFDPFSLETYVARSASAPPSAQVSLLAAPRRPIRIPFRPALRSPFRPDWGF